MRIGFDAKRIFQNTTGLGNYSRTLVNALVTIFPEHEYYLFAPEIHKNLYQNENVKTIHPQKGLAQFLWRSYGINNDLKKHEINIYHGLSNEIPLAVNSQQLKTVVTIHDLIFKYFPQQYALPDRIIYNSKSRYACMHADSIIATSIATKNDIINNYNINENKIQVIYQACNPLFQDEQLLQNTQILKMYSIPGEYILYVGSITERKNLLHVCKAYNIIPEINRVPCVVIGKCAGTYFSEIKKYIYENNLHAWFIFLDNLEDKELPAIYAHALAFIYPSFYEGFGIPVLEAMACGCPVITSNTSSLPEVAGDSALFVNPAQVDEIAFAIQKLVANQSLQKELSIAGKKRALDFSAQKSALQTMEVYNNLMLS